MYDNPNLPYRCPKCLQSVSDYMKTADNRYYSCGCMTMSCDAPVFNQEEGESIYAARIKWDKWVIKYRNEHPNWHRESLCGGCGSENTDCAFYHENHINCAAFWRK